MDASKEEGRTACEEVAAAQIESANNGSRASANKQITPFGKDDTNQSA
jgi:hypothetical protein